MRPTQMMLLASAISLAACEPDSTTAPRVLPQLQTATYYVQETEGRTLPAVVAQRGSEYDVLDSAYLAVTEEGYWTQRAYLRRFDGETLLSSFTVEEAGSWAAEPAGYIFATNQSEEAFIIPDAFWDNIATTIRLPGVTASLPVIMHKQFATP